MPACAICGNQNNPGLKFCTSCGKPLAVTAPAPPGGVAGRTCPSCGTSVPENVKFSIQCGKPLLQDAPHPPGAVPPPPIAPPLAPPAPVVSAPPPPPPSVVPAVPPFGPSAPVMSASSPAWTPVKVPSGGPAGTQPAPNPHAFTAPPGPAYGPQKSAAGKIVAAVILLVALGASGYYGYLFWKKAHQLQPQASAALAPTQPTANPAQPAASQSAQTSPAGAQPVQTAPAPVAVNPANIPAKRRNLPATSVQSQQPQAQTYAPAVEYPVQPTQPAQPAMPPEPVPPTRPTPPISSAQGVLIQQVPPKYPKLAKMAHISGPVRLQITVGTNGAVKNVNVISGHRLLRKAAIDAVQQWLYRPYMLNGKPTEIQTEVTVNFTLDEQ